MLISYALHRNRPSKYPILGPWAGTVILSVYLGVPDGPGVGEEIARVGIGRAGGKLIEYVAEIRPRVETVPRRTHAHAEQHGGGLSPPSPPTCSQFDRPTAKGRMARSASPLSIANRESSRNRTSEDH